MPAAEEAEGFGAALLVWLAVVVPLDPAGALVGAVVLAVLVGTKLLLTGAVALTIAEEEVVSFPEAVLVGLPESVESVDAARATVKNMFSQYVIETGRGVTTYLSPRRLLAQQQSSCSIRT